MQNQKLKKVWVVNEKKKISSLGDIIDALLANRNIDPKDSQEFFNPRDPNEIPLKEFKLSAHSIKKSIKRLKLAKKRKEAVLVYGDYDADGICATAILWEALYAVGVNAIPYIPDRFEEGYGLNSESVKNLKKENEDLKVIVTVDNGIVAHEAVEIAKDLGIDVIVTDHHEPGEKYPPAYSVIHSQEIGGAGVAWVFARYIFKAFKKNQIESLGLAAIGSISDQIPLVGANRAIVKYGLKALNSTNRVGLIELYNEAGITKGSLDTYSIGFVIAPRINAMGRLEHAIDSLRLLCTKSSKRAKELASFLGKTNLRRQEIVNEVVMDAKAKVELSKDVGVIVIASETYHEGVIGLIASKLVEEFYRPAIVFSKGNDVSKASARSVEGFNIIDAIRKLDNFLLSAGGHPMAAGVSISTKDIKRFSDEINKVARKNLKEIELIPKLKIDLEVDFKFLDWNLLDEISKFAPTGPGNPNPLFLTKDVVVWKIRTIGTESRHLKMRVEKDNVTFDAIGFGLGWRASELTEGISANIAYYFEENIYNGVKSMQLRIKDLKF